MPDIAERAFEDAIVNVLVFGFPERQDASNSNFVCQSPP